MAMLLMELVLWREVADDPATSDETVEIALERFSTLYNRIALTRATTSAGETMARAFAHEERVLAEEHGGRPHSATMRALLAPAVGAREVPSSLPCVEVVDAVAASRGMHL
ncbi:hypothetical protein [Methylopila sp. Yamaguchi]|uniref:hypothetical protein n=1 Tax=Methylopila sp. Yamaguchi TaxID=1437817 RepID=UPI0011AF3296|nr:hypothetical protein [Methylopila sp. Yamaguchi]